MTALASKPIQRRLALTVKYDPPLMKVDAASGVLKVSNEEVAALYEDKKLAWAWDIGLGKRRDEVRILSKCVSGLQARGWPDNSEATCGLMDSSESEIIGWILAREKNPWIDAPRLESLFRSSESCLIYDLVRAGELKLLPGSDAPRRGRNGQGSIARDSVVSFLKRRRVQ